MAPCANGRLLDIAHIPLITLYFFCLARFLILSLVQHPGCTQKGKQEDVDVYSSRGCPRSSAGESRWLRKRRLFRRGGPLFANDRRPRQEARPRLQPADRCSL